MARAGALRSGSLSNAATIADVGGALGAHGPGAVAVLVDFDNIFPGQVTPAATEQTVDRLIRRVLDQWPETGHIEVRFYGGWLDEGLLTNRASELEAALASSTSFPIAHPTQSGLLRGSLQLATRLAAIPGFQWAHTLRTRVGLPRIRLADQPYPAGCAHRDGGCPVKAVQKLAGRPRRECSASGCRVTNEDAFRVSEQKMVDVMLACDTLAFAGSDWNVLVLSSDLDVLPAVAFGASQDRGEVLLIRQPRYAADLYADELEDFGVVVENWNT